MKSPISACRCILSLFVICAMFGICSFGQGPKGTIEIVNLYDAFGREMPGVVHDWGFSALIRYRGKTILFDSGTNARKLEQNAKALKVKLSKVDIAILSHSHYDHLGGFDYLLERSPKVKIYTPSDFTGIGAPSVFPFRDRDPAASSELNPDEVYFRGTRTTDGMLTVPTGRFWKYDSEFINSAKEILPGLTLIPTTADLMGTYVKYPPFDGSPRLSGLPELSAVFSTAEGDVIISGCSHSGIRNIVSAAKGKRESKVRLVLGGFHLIPYERGQIAGLALELRDELKVEAVAPAHCTGHLGFSVFRSTFGSNYKFFGLGEKLVLSDGVEN
jgi:7,8-dihydropterin-6-yl-methyl-4-(beta-D-ribofuranosyl)aminobenzene 5'-phosphate synthase